MYLKERYIHSPYSCLAKDLTIYRQMMFFPQIQPWVKETREHPAFRIEGGDVAAFVSIADTAAKSEIVFDRLPSVLDSDYVIYFMFRKGHLL